jgi:tetratricopeptide (TPR) repeat protein
MFSNTLLFRRVMVSVVAVMVLVGAAAVLLLYGDNIADAWRYRGLTTTVSRDMDDATRTYLLEQTATARANIEKAQQSGEKADLLDAYLDLAFHARLLGDLVTAREALEVQLEGNPLHYTAWNNYGTVLEEMGDLDLAEQAYRQAVVAGGGQTEEHWRDLIVFLQTYRPERGAEVEDLLKEGVKRVGQTSWFMVTLGDWYRAQGDCDRALDHYEVAVRLAPQITEIGSTLAEIQAECAAAP